MMFNAPLRAEEGAAGADGGDLTAITQAIKRGTVEALEFAEVAYKAGAKRNKYVG